MPTLILTLIFSFSISAGENRILIVSGPTGSMEKALNKLSQEKSALTERDVIIKTRSDDKFSIRLIGKDGGEKWQGQEDFQVNEILKKIDQMPMRLEEIKKQRVIGR